jgi:hypothetical protein
MADGFMDRQPEIGRIEHKVVFARGNRLRPELSLDLLRGRAGFGEEVVSFDILKALAARGRKACAGGEPAGLPIDGGDLEIGRAAHAHLRNSAAAAAGKQLLLAYEAHERGAVTGAGRERRLVDGEKF